MQMHRLILLLFVLRECTRVMAEKPSKKKPKIVDFGRDSYASASAVSSILKKAKEDGIPDGLSTFAERYQRRAKAYQSTNFGPLVQDVTLEADDGSEIKLPVQHPLAMIEVICREIAWFATWFLAILRNNGNKLKLMLYSDEVTPGNAVQHNNLRKTQCVYWNFEESGAAMVCEHCWFILMAVRSTVEKRISGGMSQITKVLLRLFFAPNGHDLRHGVFMDIGGTTVLVFAELSKVIQDERAHKAMFHCKGAGGNKLCMCCKNVARHTCNWLPDPRGYLISSA